MLIFFLASAVSEPSLDLIWPMSASTSPLVGRDWRDKKLLMSDSLREELESKSR